jgi:AraC family L-rhamnose operon transcriptional activator RhaR/AraC family L-rhamnose operon regulatory protein RhaS
MKDNILTYKSFFSKATQLVKVLKRDPEMVYPLHGHDFYELVLAVSGTGIQYCMNHDYEIGPGSLFLIPIGMQHGYKELHDLVLYNVMIKKELIDYPLFDDITKMPGFRNLLYPGNNFRTYRVSPEQCQKLVSYFDIIQKENSQHLDFMGSDALSFATTLTMLVTIGRIIQSVPFEESSVNQRMDRIFDFLNDNLSRNVTTEELMKIANMSCSTLNRYFHKTTGLSPIEYHIQKRISNACELIHLTDKSMEEIAELVGFPDASYFSRQFKKVMKISPSEYRESWKTWDFDMKDKSKK